MLLNLLKAKLHRATVTGCDLDYEGSLRLDPELMERASILPFEFIQVYNINTGARFETYAISGERGSRECVLNGAAARLACRGDLVIIVALCSLTPEEAREHRPRIVLLGEGNVIKEVAGEA